MKTTLLLISTVLLSACSSFESGQENQNSDKESYVLFDSKGIRVSEHRNFNECNAAGIRYNLRKLNDASGITKTYERTPKQFGKETITCRKRA